MGTPWTKGPWEVAEGDGQYLWEVRAPREKAKARRTIARPAGPDRLANARLIASAPDLAEALEPIAAIDIDHMADLPDDDRVLYLKGGIRLGDIRRARAALSKARGETA